MWTTLKFKLFNYHFNYKTTTFINGVRYILPMEIAITTMSSKGQVVIPAEMRKDLPEGEKIIIIKEGKQLILKRTEDLNENLKEDLVFAKKTEEAFQRINSGKGITMKFDDFINEMKKW